jgi:hypothetical protein
MALTVPMHGRHTGMWISTCRDCGTSIRSNEQFSVIERKALKWSGENISKPETSINYRAAISRITAPHLGALNARDPKLRQMREPGEEG